MGLSKAPADVVGAMALRRTDKRRVFRRSGIDDASALIGELRIGDEVCGLTNGQFSLVDIIEHILSQTGPAYVTVATWTMGIYDVDRSFEFVRNKLIRGIRFVLDPSMFSRRPEIASILVRGFGVDSFRAVNSHAKFATIRGDGMAVCVRSSMNLNPNNRIESFDISVCDETTRFFEAFVDAIWNKVDVDSRTQSSYAFRDLLDEQTLKPSKRANPWRNLGVT